MDVFFADDSVQVSGRGGAGYVMSFGGVWVMESELRPLTTPSNFLRQLQLADLAVGITTAMVCGNAKFAGPLFPIIQQMLIVGNGGRIGGSGLKIGPGGGNGFENLYHWILGETSMIRGAGATGMRIPEPTWPYGKNPLIR